MNAQGGSVGLERRAARAPHDRVTQRDQASVHAPHCVRVTLNFAKLFPTLSPNAPTGEKFRFDTGTTLTMKRLPPAGHPV
jgi:hypothetical protein